MLYYVNGLILRRLFCSDYLLGNNVQSDLKKTAEIFVKIFKIKIKENSREKMIYKPDDM